MNVISGQGLPDFVMLDQEKVTEDGFMDNLKARFKAKQIYTYIGEQVVSVNPFQYLPQLYENKTLESYKEKYMYEVQPHIYALGDDTFRSLMQNNRDQCVIITGESGAGKTEASKVFLQYITKISGSGGVAETIKKKLLESNPILESFGNAKTLRNDNSSRFGKYLEIQFDGAGAPMGGRLSQYLLEKSRVVTRANGERSFHIYYMLLAQKSLVSKYMLKSDPEEYEYLAISECFTTDHQDDAKEFKVVEQAMTTLQFTPEDRDIVWTVLAATLRLGNIMFKPVAKVDGVTDGSTVENVEELEAAAKLLKVNQAALQKSLTSRTITTGVMRTRSEISVYFSKEQAEKARDSFAKALYNSVFTLVTERINKSIEADKKKVEVVIGVLDIYGFEIFENNSFEQFCINYCNEKLQQIFIKLVLKEEQEEYVKEGIEWKEIDYFNNNPIVELIEGKHGIYKKLDEACMIGNVTPKQLLQKFDQDFNLHPFYDSYSKSKGKVHADNFRIKHYAGEVDYEIEQFADKNRDTLFRDLKHVLQESEIKLIAGFYPKQQGEDDSDKKRPVTAGWQFVVSVRELIHKLEACQPHYIRCIKANDKKTPFGFDEERIRHQVRYLNLVETVRVRRAGFCNRQPYPNWVRRYKMVCPETWPTWKGTDIDGSQKILNSMKVESEEYRKGKTKLFVRNVVTLFKAEKARAEFMPMVAVAIQRRWRGFLEREPFKRREAAVLFQRLWRGVLARRKVKQLKNLRIIQTWVRFTNANAEYPVLENINKIQTWWRFNLASLHVENLATAHAIQTWSRYNLAQQHYEQEQAVLNIQTWFRFHFAATKLEKEKSSVVVTRNYRGFKARKFAVAEKKRIARRAASTLIQKLSRGFLARKYYEANKERLRLEREAAIKRVKNGLAQLLQGLWRAREAVLNERREKATIVHQKFYRALKARRELKQLKAIAAIQQSWRVNKAHEEFKLVEAITNIQQAWRNYKARETQQLYAAIEELQTAWRHRNARVHYYRVRASSFLQTYYRHYIRHRYTNRVNDVAGGTKMKKEEDNYGKNLRLPAYHPAPLQRTSDVFSKIQYFWWAHNKIHSLSKADNVLMRQKVITLDLFRGKKKWDPARTFSANYMSDAKLNKHAEDFSQAIQELFSAGGDSHIYFADAVIKVNRRGASQIQVIVATDAHIYKYEPKKYKMIKQGTPFTAINNIHLTPGPDTFMVIEMEPPYRDMVLDLGTNGCERFSELTTILYAHRKALGRPLDLSGTSSRAREAVVDVTFEKTIKFNNSRKEKDPGHDIVLSFEPHQKPQPGCKFKGPSKGTATVFYDPDVNIENIAIQKH